MRDYKTDLASPSTSRATEIGGGGNTDVMETLAMVAATGRLHPHAVATLIATAPQRKDAILLFLQRAPGYGNSFVRHVLELQPQSPGSVVTNTPATPAASPAPSRTLPGMTGDRYLDEGAYNDREAMGRLFGDAHSSKRSRVIDEVRHRIDDAGKQCSNAILSLRMDKLAEKAESDLPMLLTFLIGLASTFVGGQLANAAKLLLSSPSATDVVVDATQTEVQEAISKVTTDRIASLTKGFSYLAKAAATSGSKSDRAAEPKAKQAREISWLDALADQVADSFSAMRSQMLAMATDGDLLVLLDGFAPSRHHQSAYKIEIAAKLQRFEESGLMPSVNGWTGTPFDSVRAGVGRSTSWTHGQNFADRSIIRVEYTSGRPGHYEFRLRTVDVGGLSRTNVATEPDEHSYLDARRYQAHHEVGMRSIDTFGWTLAADGEVPREFENEAIALQMQTWGRPPEIIMREDREFATQQPQPQPPQPLQVPSSLTLQPTNKSPRTP